MLPSGAPRRARAFVHDFGDARDAANGRRMRADDDRASCLQRDENLVDGRRRRVGRGHDRRHDPERLRDLDDLAIFQTVQDADGLHRANEAVDPIGGKLILLDLVGDDAVSGFFDRQLRERLALRRDGRRHRVDDGVDALLRQLRDFHLRLLGTARERARFGHRSEIAIGGFGGGNGLRTRHVPRAVRVWVEFFRLRRAAAE